MLWWELRCMRECSKPLLLLAETQQAEPPMDKKNVGLSDRQLCHGAISSRNWPGKLLAWISNLIGICFLSIQQHWEVYWNNLHPSFPNLNYSELEHIFSKESWVDIKSHMSEIISESFINKPGLGRAHLRLQSVFLGWAPKLPDSWTIICSFHATLRIYFTEALYLLFIHIHFESILVSCRSRGTKIVE